MSRTARYAASYDARRSFPKRLIGPLLGVLVLFYLGFHAVSGANGLWALFSQTHKLEVLKAELAEVSAKRQALDTKVHHLSNSSLDLDLLDEQARVVLGLAGKNEIVYFLDEKK